MGLVSRLTQTLPDATLRQAAVELRDAVVGMHDAVSASRAERAGVAFDRALMLARAGTSALGAAKLVYGAVLNDKNDGRRRIFARHFGVARLVIAGDVKADDARAVAVAEGFDAVRRTLLPPDPKSRITQADDALSRLSNLVRDLLDPPGDRLDADEDQINPDRWGAVELRAKWAEACELMPTLTSDLIISIRRLADLLEDVATR